MTNNTRSIGKLVVLKIGDGCFDQGFPVTLQILEEGKSPLLEITGRLPPAPEIMQSCQSWTTSYHSLGLRSRLEASVVQVTNVSKLERCYNAAQVLGDRLNAWLSSEPFRPIKEKLLEQLLPSDEIRLIIQTENSCLRRLPWHLWDFWERYSKAEIALSALKFEPVTLNPKPHQKVKILAIIGNSIGIDTEADQKLLEKLPDAQLTFLIEPKRQQVHEALWEQSWDILFFAGHSSSKNDGKTGHIYINKTDSLTINQLKFGLKRAIGKGLKIAIFNSCDGLGLASNLANLQIPQIIVMREPVPDRVSQEFLKYFLTAFAGGQSFYLAVREARERLQGIEDEFPCATWLPIICQNPAAKPPTWPGLRDSFDGKYPLPPPPPPPPPPPRPEPLSFVKVLVSSLVITCFLIVIQQLGLLQGLELKAFDHLINRRPAEFPDSRLIVVEVTEEDIEAQQSDLRPATSLSDRSLQQLLEILNSSQAKVIGLDIHRDFPVAPDYQDLGRLLEQSENLVTVCKASNEEDKGISPPPEVPKQNLGFSDVVVDPDGVIRRHLLAFNPDPKSVCSASYALSTQLAMRYLVAEGIFPKYTEAQKQDKQYLQLGDVVFKPLTHHTGSYHKLHAWGHQIMLNYRFHQSPEDFVPQVTLSQVLKGKINPDAFKGKIVLIGVTAPSRKDYLFTPYSKGNDIEDQTPGVIIHAHMVSQILSAVLDERPLIRHWPAWREVVWIWGWGLTVGLVCWRCKSSLRLGVLLLALSILYGSCLGLLKQGYWVPLVPSALAVVVIGSFIVLYDQPSPYPLKLIK
ncbi:MULTISPECIES: CHASE2 domain-containing protein [Moorena]|uniref:Putative transmembrane sensor domain protein n=1 Tax=Moorena producens 3L TaxID=489825 RepID=F4XVL6_9CYAN|nr:MULTISPECIES: CHASE2 domain-containing protein [Moorena]EGJ31279.1 putative transmembrane sensor domain protein [Moorena producens 3L]